jgi:cyclophilin family peptidyl-prolyl cis-trans isomerase
MIAADAVAGLPTDQIKATVDKALVVLKDPRFKPPAKQQERREQLKQILFARFDFAEMAKRSLGADWRRRTPQEQEDFVRLFTDVLERAYADIIESYTNEKIVYVNEKFYDGTIFHRVIPAFMIQGGGFDKDMNQKKTKAPIKNEAGNGLKNTSGTIAMARTSDPNSATAQFFINTKDNAFLDHKNDSPQGMGYAVFGKVVGGMDVVKKIEQVQTTTKKPNENVPVTPVIIESVRVVD